MKLGSTFVILLFSLTSFGQRTDLKLASDVWPPFTDVAPEEAFAIDLVKEAMNRNAIAVDLRILDFQNVLTGIEKGAFDGSAALWYTDERDETMLFSEPYLVNKLVLVGPKGSDVSYTSYDELSGKSVALVKNYAYGSELESAEGIEWVMGANDQENLLKVLKGEVDYMLVDALLIAYLSSYQADDSKRFLEIGNHGFLNKSLHFALNRNVEGVEELMDLFNQEIQKMMADGTYNRILKLNWIEADVDGDGLTELVPMSNQVGIQAPKSAYNVSASLKKDSSAFQRVYIDGQLYESWDEVPAQYKRGNIRPEDYDDVSLMRFSF
jgi:ABC-type amino acid transport substrate-binding protein